MASLLVPIALDALVVRGATPVDDWALTAVNVPKPQVRGHRKHELLSPPFQSLAATRPPGVYLHWALPDALTRGVPDGSDLKFPPVPDRWLVVRASGPASPGPRPLEAWLLPNAGAGTPVRLAHALTGPALPAEGAAPVAPLTALGHGDPGWAAYYDNVVDRFALYDDLQGVTGPVSYLVCGWYRDQLSDPLAALSESDFHDRMARLRWELASPLASGAPYPTRSVYHAAALAIGWPQPTWPGDGGAFAVEPDLRPDPEKIDAAVGETLAEALAALAADELDGPEVAPLLEGALLGALGDIASSDGPATLDTTLHVSRFGSTPAEAKTEYIWQPSPPPVTTGTGPLPPSTGAFRPVKRAAPRVWHALDPTLVVRGAGRSPKHGADGRFTIDGNLVCRLEDETVTSFGVTAGDAGRGAAVLPATPLAGLPAAYGVPAVAGDLLVELSCLDPGAAPDLASATAAVPSPVAAARTRWWAAFDPAVPAADALTGAAVAGILPSPVGVSPPMRPWSPLHVEWSAAYLPSPRGAHDWQLGDTDFTPLPLAVPPDVDPDHPLAGRVLLNASPSLLLNAAAGSAADDLSGADLLSGAFTGIAAQLRGDSTAAVIAPKDAKDSTAKPPRPDNFLALRAGFLRFERLRVVDGFGQHVDLLGAGAIVAVAPRIGAGLAVEGHDDLVALRPRFTAPARVLLRFADALGAKVDAGPGVSPVCGYLVPAIDGTLEFFDADGGVCGRLRPDVSSGTAWEDDPGRTTALGARPNSMLPNPFLGALADGILAADLAASGADAPRTTTALRSLLSAVDTTSWSVDVTGRAGDEHLAMLTGRPIAVVRAVLRVEIQDPHKPPENETTAVPVKLGTLAHAQDGLLAYFVDDDFSRARVVDPAVGGLAATLGLGPIRSPYVDLGASFFVNPGTEVAVTLLMMPGSDVHVTTGLLPQKRLSLVREWTAPALTRLAPALRFGPVLRDGDTTRLPVAPDIRANWLWHRRADPTTWVSDTVIPSTTSALLPDNPVSVSFGWLQALPIPDTPYVGEAVQVEISSVTKDRGAVSGLGGRNPDGSLFLIPIDQAVRLQESGRFAFYVDQVAGVAPVFMKILRTARGAKYMRTTTDRRSRNNLVNLPIFVDEQG
jgi:hypothetical protein